jgi:hypothetical protein
MEFMNQHFNKKVLFPKCAPNMSADKKENAQPNNLIRKIKRRLSGIESVDTKLVLTLKSL